MTLVVGVDVATAAVRIQVHDAAGTLVTSAVRALPAPMRSAPGRSEQDATTWWPAVRDGLAECTSALDERRHEIASLAISATSGTVVLVDRDGGPVGPALMYDDRRAVDEGRMAVESGSQRWSRIGITPSAGSGLARIAWLAGRYRHDAVLACHTPDLIAHHLVGHPVPSDTSHALKSGYDPVAEEWAFEVFDALAVSSALLPDVVRPTGLLGHVSRDAAEQTGIPVGCVVRAGMTDGCAGQLATGTVDVGQFVTILGTTLVIKGVSERRVWDPAGAVYNHLHPEGTWLPGGAANVGGSVLSDVDSVRLRELDAAASWHGPSTVVNFPLRGRGERFPFVAEYAEGFLLGNPVDDVDEHRSRLEGVAFCERLALEHLGQLGAPPTATPRTAGGGARSTSWCRIRASVLRRPVLRVPEAGTALGAALLAAVGSVHPNLSVAAAAMVPEGEQVNPIEAETSRLEESYRMFRAELISRGWLNAAG